MQTLRLLEGDRLDGDRLLRAAEGGDQWAKDFLARLKNESSAEGAKK